jgi:hypothetical protein
VNLWDIKLLTIVFFRKYIPSKIDYSQKLVDQIFSLHSAKHFVRPHPLWTLKPLNVSRTEEATYKRPYLVNVTAIILSQIGALLSCRLPESLKERPDYPDCTYLCHFVSGKSYEAATI